jgi:MFS family permease
MSRYIGPIKWLGGIAITLFIFAALFGSFVPGLVDEATRRGVLFNAIPFFAAFIGVLLLFILLIALVALRFNGKIPDRTYKGVENVIVFSIIIGVICLFNPWSFIPYRYGFLLLLVATLSFILWSHVAPPRTELEDTLLPITPAGHVAGLLMAAVIVAILAGSAISANGPKEPYGVRERVWNSYDDERKAQIASDAVQQFNQIEMPFLVIFNLIPGAVIYLFTRELVGGRRRVVPAPSLPVAAAGD